MASLSLDKRKLTLDASGVAGVFGGDEAVSAMATVHVFGNRRWLGWYNSPGSYQIAKRYAILAKSRFLDSCFPGIHTDPTTLFESDGSKGPKFIAAHSGSIIEETGHLAALFMGECASMQGKIVEGRETRPVGVTIAELNGAPEPQMCPRRVNAYSAFFAAIPISVSVGACAACGASEDWFSFLSILLGILASGISCLAIGSGKLVFTHPEPAKGSPAADGILGSGREIVLLKGAEGAVNSVTHGRFKLTFPSERQFRYIRWCSALLTIQFIAQLLLIPQGTQFGQIMFITSLAVSWIYNAWLSSLDKKIQQRVFLNSVLGKPVLTKYHLGTHTAMVIFTILVLQPEEPSRFLNKLLPDDTRVWRQWKGMIERRLLNQQPLEFASTDWQLRGFDEQEKSLLETLYEDAEAAYRGYAQYAAPRF